MKEQLSEPERLRQRAEELLMIAEFKRRNIVSLERHAAELIAMANKLESLRCSFCDGVWHPATGCEYGPRIRACGPCTRSFWTWMQQHTRARKGKPSFYDAAVKFKPAPSSTG